MLRVVKPQAGFGIFLITPRTLPMGKKVKCTDNSAGKYKIRLRNLSNSGAAFPTPDYTIRETGAWPE